MDIAAWLRGLGLERYEPAFRENEIDWASLPRLTWEDLRDLGVVLGSHRRRLLDAIAQLRSGSPLPTPPPLAGEGRVGVGGGAERRQLTVMFSDLVASTALSARLDPEDLREVIGAYHRCVAETVARFAGFVAKYMGDGVLVYFGYPQADEDDAERAVRAGLAVIDAVGRLATLEPLNVRLGIASGLVVVGDLIGAGAAQERGVVGETPNLAARLQALAGPNTLVIAENTRRQIGALFDLDDLGLQPFAGFTEPQRAWRVVGESTVVSRFDALRSESIPLIGRNEELELLQRRWQQAKTGEGRVVLISGEPGIGKSRLTVALSQAIQSDQHTRLRYFCSPHHQDSVLHPFIAQLEHAAGFTREDSPAARLDKLETLLAQGGAGTGGTAALFADLLGLPTEDRYPALPQDPQRRREMTLAALLDQLAGLARRHPVLLLFEDAHWADSTSLELVDRIVERLRDLPVLMVATFRPEFAPPWVGQAHVTSLALSRLGGREATALVGRVAGGKRLPSEILDRIVERTDGIPLFIEELTKSVLEGGLLREQDDGYALAGPLPPLAIPATLHASLMARLDRLAPVREVAQIGAAIGRDFSWELLAAIARRSEAQLADALDQLAAAGLVFRRGVPPRATFSFKHALVQDAAYSTLLRGQRRELHARIAKALEERFPETQPEVLAHHCTEAGLTAAAVQHWCRAGERALEHSAHVEAVAHLKRALELAAELETGRDRARTELNLQIALATALHALRGQSAAEVEGAYERARLLAEETGDLPQLFRALLGLWRSGFGAESERLFEIAQQTQDPDLLLEAYMVKGVVELGVGDLAKAQHFLDLAITHYDLERHRSHAMRFSLDPGVNSLSRSSWTLWLRGYPDQALERSNRTIALARKLDHVHSLGLALSLAAMLHQFRREPRAVQAIAQEAEALSRQHRLSQWLATSRFLSGWASVQQGESKDGIQLMWESLGEYRQIGAKMYLAWFISTLAEALAASGKTPDALEAIDEANRISGPGGILSDVFPSESLRIKAALLLASERRSEAEQCLDTALVMARRRGTKILELRTSTCLARLMRDQGKRAEARDLLAPVYGWFTEGFDTADLKDARALLDELGA
jgi:class 3 adenylate cyclase/predicted ATPase